MAENKPTNKELWERAKAAARQKFDVYPSAYANAWAVKWYKDKGGGWKKMAEGGLTEWFDEKWVDLGRPKEGGGYEECGRSDADEGKYPKCVPAAKAATMTESEKKSAVKRKRAAESDGKGGKPTNVSTFAKKLAGGGMVADQITMAPLLKEQYSDKEIESESYSKGGYVVTRTSERKGKTHKVTGPDGSVKYFGDPNLKNRPNNPEAKKSWYARHAKSLKENPHFRAYARATWAEGGIIPAGFETMVSGDFNDPNMPQPQLFAKGAKVKEPVEEGGEGDLSGLPAGAYEPETMSEYVRRTAAESEAARQAAIAAAAAEPISYEEYVRRTAAANEQRRAAEAFEAGRAAGQRQEEALMRPAPETLEGLEAVRAAELRDAAREEEARARFVPAGRDEASAQAVERIAELTPPIIPPSLGAFIKPIREAKTIEEFREVLDKARPAFDIADPTTREKFAGLMRTKFSQFAGTEEVAPQKLAKRSRGDDMAGGLTEFDSVEETTTVAPQQPEGVVKEAPAPKTAETKPIPLDKAAQYEALKDDRKEAIYRSALAMGASDQEAKAIAVDIVGARTAGSTSMPTAAEKTAAETSADAEAQTLFDKFRAPPAKPVEVKPEATPTPAPAPAAKPTETPAAATKPAEATPTPTPAPAPAVEAPKPVAAPPAAPPPAAPKVAPLAPADRRALELKDITDRGLGGQYQIVKTAAMRIGNQDDATAHDTAYATITGKTYAGTTPADIAAAEARARTSPEFQNLQRIKEAQLAAAQELFATDVAARKIKEKVAAAQEELLLREREKFEAQRRALELQSAALRKQVLEDKVDPNRFLADPRNNIKTASVIGILGKFLGAKTSVQDYIQKKINDDIELQQKEMGRRKTVLSDLVSQGNSLEDSFKLTDAFYKQLFALQIEREAGGLKDRKARADALKLAADLSLEANKQQELIVKNRISEEFKRLGKGVNAAGAKALDTFEGLRLLLQDEGIQRAGARAGRAASLREEELGLKKVKEFGTPLEQQARGGASISGKQLGQLPRDTQKLAVPVYTFSENPDSQGMIMAKDKFVLSQGEPKDAEAIRESDREAMQFLGTIKKLRDVAKDYNFSGFVAGVGPLSADKRKADQAKAEGYQRDIIAFLARKTFYNTGTPQEGEYKRLQEAAPDATRFQSGAYGKAQFDRFYEMAVMAAKSARESRLRAGLTGSGPAADLGAEAP